MELKMSTKNEQKADLLNKTANYYRRSIENYGQFSRTERKPRTKKQLELRLQTVLQEIDSLKHKPGKEKDQDDPDGTES